MSNNNNRQNAIKDDSEPQNDLDKTLDHRNDMVFVSFKLKVCVLLNTKKKATLVISPFNKLHTMLNHINLSLSQ